MPRQPKPGSVERRDRLPDLRGAGASAAPRFRPIHTRRAFEEICERIREQLALGVLKPGDKLPPEQLQDATLTTKANVEGFIAKHP